MKFVDYLKSIDTATKKAIALVAAAVIVFWAGLSCGTYTKVSATVNGDVSALLNSVIETQPAQNVVQTSQPQLSQSEPATTQAPADTTPSTPSNDSQTPSSDAQSTPSDSTTSAPAGDTSADAGSSTGMPQGTEAIVNYYNEAANKVKSSASSVTLNYVDRMANDEYLEVSGTLKSVASFAMNTFLTKDENPVTLTGDDIKTTFPVKNEDYSSKLTAAQVKNATCTDNGTEYEIKIELLNDDVPNCTAGNGYGSCMNYLGAEEITLDYPGLSISDVNLTYHDGVIIAKIDKATGNLVYANYTLPVVLALNAKLFTSSIPAQIGMTFVEDYTIAY